MLHPDHPDAPKYWMYEQSGVLHPVIEKYLNDREMTAQDVAAMRAYLRQWIKSPAWNPPPGGEATELIALRGSVERIGSVADIDTWIEKALAIGIDPL